MWLNRCDRDVISGDAEFEDPVSVNFKWNETILSNGIMVRPFRVVSIGGAFCLPLKF